MMAAVLCIACANVAGLLLVRTAARQREMAMRLALGAGRGRLVRQLLTESVVLSALGASAGVVLAFIVRGSLLPALNQDETPIELALGTSPWVLAFSIGMCLIVGLGCGLLPALRATPADARLALGRVVAGRGTGGPRLFAGRSLIALQVALSLVLLVGAALFTRTLLNLRSQALGFRLEQLLLVRMDATTAGYEDRRLLDFYETVLERIAAIPGVQSAAFSRWGLLEGGATRDGIKRARRACRTAERRRARPLRVAGLLRDDGDSAARRPRRVGAGSRDRAARRRRQPGGGAADGRGRGGVPGGAPVRL